jgi:hypothetical protein
MFNKLCGGSITSHLSSHLDAFKGFFVRDHQSKFHYGNEVTIVAAAAAAIDFYNSIESELNKRRGM